MPVFITVTDADILDASFWAALDVGADSTIDVSNVSDTIQITLTGTSIVFSDSASGTTTTYTNADLASGSFSEFVQFVGNDANNVVSGSVGLNAAGYIGGAGDDSFTDDGTLGGSIDGGGGDDTLIGGIGSNNIFGRAGDDVLRGGAGNNNLSGGAGADTLFGEDGSGNLDGGADDDVIFAGSRTTFVQGGSGTDSLVIPAGSAFAPFFPGSTGGIVALPDGSTFVYINIENVAVACFVNGTMIKTPHGYVPIETLAVGDLVETLDHGPQPIRWAGTRTVSGRGRHAPITFLPNSIGNTRKIKLSPQHRVYLSGWRCELLFHTSEVLCAAKYLCDGDQIFSHPCDEVAYTHIMFDRHEIVFSEGALLESFFVGDYVAKGEEHSRDELEEIFPELVRKTHTAPYAARRFLKRHEALLLAEASSVF